MLIRLYWTQCTLTRPETQPIDSFWVEATQQEAENFIFPYCSTNMVAQSQAYGVRDKAIANKFGHCSRSYCFLIAQDLSTIKPLAVHYPYSPMWSAYSPFQKIEERYISNLEELKTFVPYKYATEKRKDSKVFSLA